MTGPLTVTEALERARNDVADAALKLVEAWDGDAAKDGRQYPADVRTRIERGATTPVDFRAMLDLAEAVDDYNRAHDDFRFEDAGDAGYCDRCRRFSDRLVVVGTFGSPNVCAECVAPVSR